MFMGMIVLHHAFTWLIIDIFKWQMKILHLILLVKENILRNRICVYILSRLVSIYPFCHISLLFNSCNWF